MKRSGISQWLVFGCALIVLLAVGGGVLSKQSEVADVAAVPTLMQLPVAEAVADEPVFAPAEPMVRSQTEAAPVSRVRAQAVAASSDTAGPSVEEAGAPPSDEESAAVAVPAEPTTLPGAPLVLPPPLESPLQVSLPMQAPVQIVSSVPSQPVAGQVVVSFAPITSEPEHAAYSAEISSTGKSEILALDTLVVSAPTMLPTRVLVDLSRYAALLARAEARGTMRVIAVLDVPFAAEAELDAQALQAQRDEVASAQATVMSAMSGQNADIVSQSDQWIIPYLAYRLDAPALRHLASLPEVIDIIEDRVFEANLNSSTEVVEANLAWPRLDGTGQTVAILDSGVQSNHPFLTGKVVSEACYSSYNADGYGTWDLPLCPNQSTSQVGTGAASPSRCIGLGFGDGCGHGTHVAGIAAGRDGHAAAIINGVGRGASVIAIQVFTAFYNPYPTLWGIGAYESDIISGLQRVYTIRSSYNIAAANLSLASDNVFSAFCDAEPIKAAIDLLNGAGIATVIASGNNFSPGGVGYPGCVSSAVTVGATDDTDAVASFSNSYTQLDLWAPGVSITSSLPIDTYDTWDGTSMAAPHVTGAWAILKQCNPSATVDQILSALTSTGQSVTDSRNNITRSRIRINAAIDWMIANVGCPGLVTPTPSSTPTTTLTPSPTSIPNRVVNGDFSNGTTSWSFTPDISRTVTSGVLNAYRMNTSSWGSITQNMSFNAGVGQSLEARFMLGNSSGTGKSVRIYLNSSTAGFTGSVTCLYTIPAHTPLTEFTMIGPVGSGWSGTGVAFQIVFQGADNAPNLLVDNVSVYQYLSTTLTSTECTSLMATPTPSSTPTNTATPTATLTPSNTATSTSTPTRSNTPTSSHTPTATHTPTFTSTPTLTFTPSATNTSTATYTASATYTPSLTPSITPTPSAPNRITNGDFSNGTANWGFTGDISRTVTGGVLNAYRVNTSSWGGITQNMAFNVAPSSQALEATFQMGNSSGTAKTVRLYLNSQSGGFTGSLTCLFTVPAFAPLGSYRMYGPVGTGWTGTGVAFQIVFTNADNAPNLLVDDVAVRHFTGVSVPSTTCSQPASTPTPSPTTAGPTATPTPSFTPTQTLTPSLTFTPSATFTASATHTPSLTPSITPTPSAPNRIINGDFSNGTANWGFTGDISRTVTSGVLNAYRMNTSSWGGVTQNMSFTVTTGQALEAAFNLGNSSGAAKTVRLYLNSASGGFAGSLTCLYTVPANTPLTPYRLLGPAGAGWTGSGVAFQIVFTSADNAPSLLVDDVAVRLHTGTSVPALDCAWTGVWPAGGSGAIGTDMIVSTAEQLPGIPEGLVPLPPPPGSPTATAFPTEPATITPPPPTDAPPTQAPSATPEPPTPAPTSESPTQESTDEIGLTGND